MLFIKLEKFQSFFCQTHTHNYILLFPLALLMCAVLDGDPQSPKAMLTFLFVSEAEESQLT